ncbi:MAG: hypothetical protein U5N85_05470 [Arcicella sp.]|nr:hypothetical protein [Arcicella sp.]
MNGIELVNKLVFYRFVDTPENHEFFMENLYKFSELNKKEFNEPDNVFDNLFNVFNDSENFEPLNYIVFEIFDFEKLKIFDESIFIDKVLNNLSKIIEISKVWTEEVFKGLLQYKFKKYLALKISNIDNNLKELIFNLIQYILKENYNNEMQEVAKYILDSEKLKG